MVDMATFTLQLGGLPGSVADSVRELDNLGRRLGNEGLGRQALDFELALAAVHSAFGDARRAASDFAYGIGVELVNQLQGALGQLLGGGTVETATLQLQIDTLAWQLAIQEAAGATAEQTQAIRDQIAALQAQQDVYTAEHRVMQDRATLADQTLPTERELKDMVAEITRNIGIYSGKVDDLSWATDIQTLATAKAVTQTDNFGAVAKGATDYMGFFTRSLGDSARAVTTTNYDLVAAGRHVIDVFNSIQAPSGYQMGTPFVPSTGIYTLHRGEAVLTAAEAAQQRRGEGPSGGNYYNYGRYQVVLPNVRDHGDFLREQGRILRGF
jgi:cell division protein FtsB